MPLRRAEIVRHAPAWLIAVLIACAMILGGGGSPNPATELMLQLVFVCVAAGWAWTWIHAQEEAVNGSLPVTLFTVVILAVPVLQLLPLPPAIWSALPGREDQLASLALIGEQNSWRPLSMSPHRTIASLLAIIPALFCAHAAARLDFPERRFVLGAIVGITIDRPNLLRTGPRAYLDLLRRNFIQMHAAVLYDRQLLHDAGGFDSDLRLCEDYDAYLRMARRHRVACHAKIVARYRIHSANMSHQLEDMLKWHLRVFDKNCPSAGDGAAMVRWREGRSAARKAYIMRGWMERGRGGGKLWRERMNMFGGSPLTSIAALLKAAMWRVSPAPMKAWLRAKVRDYRRERAGDLDFGDLARIEPIDFYFGYGRGQPVDRHYMELFLGRHAGDIRGRVLELGDARYTRQFGTGISASDVVNIAPGNPATTIAGNITTPGVLPEGAFDCIIAVQTLQYLPDPRLGLARLHSALKPGGVLLLTAPAISPIVDEERAWLWSFTASSVAQLLDETFGPGSFEVNACGNAFAATCFVQGIAMEDIDPAWLEPQDISRAILVTARAVRGN